MKKFFHRIVAQRNIGKQWGVIAQVAGQLSIFAGMMSLFLIAVTAYNTTLSGWLVQHGVYINFWVFAVVIGFLLIIPAVLIWKFAIPSFFSTLNEQVYQHENPIRRDIAKLAEDNAEIKRLLRKAMKRQKGK